MSKLSARVEAFDGKLRNMEEAVRQLSENAANMHGDGQTKVGRVARVVSRYHTEGVSHVSAPLVNDIQLRELRETVEAWHVRRDQW